MGKGDGELDGQLRTPVSSEPLRLNQGAVPLWSWCNPENLEPGCLQQALGLTAVPSAVHVALMPDAHFGYSGMPIGAVLATEDTVVPDAVGSDIGCGMIAVKTSYTVEELRPHLKDVMDQVYAHVPVGMPGKNTPKGFGSQSKPLRSKAVEEWLKEAPDMTKPTAQEVADRARVTLATLGSSNHFLEFQKDEEDTVWFMVHSGSRSFGKQICDHFIKIALAEAAADGVHLENNALATLSLKKESGQEYLRNMNFAMRFAEESRQGMADQMGVALANALGFKPIQKRIETHHNYASVESHLGRMVTVHRKGAVRTFNQQDQKRLEVTIPGSMQTGSYIGFGKENALALNTCAHGAGRVLGRNAARKALKDIDIVKEMADAGILLKCPPHSDVLDEAGKAYKDIENVMYHQAELVEPLIHLAPLGVVKG